MGEMVIANPWGEFKRDVCTQLKSALSKLGWKPPKPVEETVEEPPDHKMGDLASTICFDLARTIHKAPSWISAELLQKIKPAGLIEKVEAAGNYLNFFVKMPELVDLTMTSVEKADEQYGHLEEKKGKVVIEHTSVNPTKPLHIGHGRNAVLGDTVAKVMRALGYEVEVQNYIDDLGRQMAETLLAEKTIKKKPKTKFDHVLGLIYADMHRRIESDPKLEEKVKKILAELEKGKGRTPATARKLAERCVKENLVTTDRLGIGYEVLVWESDLVRAGLLKDALTMLKSTSRLVDGTDRHAGTLVLKLSEYGMDDKVLVRSDGTAVYTARDIAYQLWKFGKTKTRLKFKLDSTRPDGKKTYTTSTTGKTSAKFGNADIVVNVVGAEQKFPQQVVFTALKLLGHEREYKNSSHLAYEHVWLPGEKFSGRKGTWVGFSVDEVMEEAVARAHEIVKEHAPDADEKFWKNAAEFVGVGAVRYSMLGTSPEKKMVFRWEEALNFERNSGPAVQYSHARACSILRKAKWKGDAASVGVLKTPQEQRLIRILAKFPATVKEAGEGLQPHLLASYASELALAFNTFYEACPVMNAENKEMCAARLRLVDCFRIVLRNAIELMGMVAPERM
jgi:arginyl-tRNA synthetase